MKKFHVAFVLLSAVAVMTSTHAATVTGSLPVAASVGALCTIDSISGIAFGAYNTQSVVDQTGVGKVSVRCTRGSTGVTIGLNTGLSASGSQNRMTDGSGSFLNYDLYQPTSTVPGAACPSAGTGTLWTNTGSGLFTLSASPSNASRSYNVCGVVPNSQDVATGIYKDTVTVTVTY